MNESRDSQVVRRGSAKPTFGSSILPPGSNYIITTMPASAFLAGFVRPPEPTYPLVLSTAQKPSNVAKTHQEIDEDVDDEVDE